ncbi:glycine zipper 2TM domain-containing protein [Ramlibacter sp. MMS24-I3-19]|uniref:glycine zipper 2TM domain-containing protein n=1 Tax=Ramlibacter sp. MMS24-I3-19 TaxID=3416606 RepID=UPI003D093420
MKQLAIAAVIATAAFAAHAEQALCDTCGHVQAVTKETRKGQGGAAGIVGGAVVGGLIGNQFGHGNGKALATVGGAAAGGFAGNEVQKHVTSKDVWVTSVKMKDGSVRKFEHAAAPGWKAGSIVKLHGKSIVRA